MIYSFAPIEATPDKAMVLFLILLLVFTVVVAAIICESTDSYIVTKAGIIGAVLSYLVTYHIIKPTTEQPKNAKVEAVFVGFVTDSWTEHSGGKNNTTRDISKQYVVYKVGDQQVLLEASVGKTYPPKAILYKN